MYVTPSRIVKAPRKPRVCYWCGTAIEGRHVVWCCIDGGKAEQVRCHEECGAAWSEAANGPERDYYRHDVGFGEHARGCCCEPGRCECVKGGTQ